MILALRTDKEEAELYLFDENGQKIKQSKYLAGRTLADTLLERIDQLLDDAKIDYRDLSGVVIFTGQGSFTGLRIGTTVANAIAFGLDIAIVKSSGKNWQLDGIKSLRKDPSASFVVPDYDGKPNITKPKS